MLTSLRGSLLVRRLLALWLLLGLGVLNPALALRVQNAQEAGLEEELIRHVLDDAEFTTDSPLVRNTMRAVQVLTGEVEKMPLPQIEVDEGIIEPQSAVIEKLSRRRRAGEQGMYHPLHIVGTPLTFGREKYVEVRWSNGRRLFVGDHHNLLYYFLTRVAKERLLPTKGRLLHMDAHPDGAALAADELPPGLDEPIERHAQYAVGNWEFHVITPEMASGYINDALWLTNPAEFPKVGVARHVVIGGQAAYPLVRMPVTWSWRIPISQRNIGGLDLDVFEPTLKIDPSLKYLPDLHESVLEVLSKCRINAIFTSPGYIRSQPALGPLIDGLVNQVITLWAIEDQLALDPESAIKRMRDVLMGHDVLLKPIVTRLIQEERRAIAFLENRAEDREDMRVQLHQLDQRLAQLLESTNPPPRPGAGLEEAGRARGDVLRAVPLLEPEAKAMIQGLFSPRAPSATPTKPQPVVALGPSVFAAFGPAERAKLTALVTHAVVAVPEDQAARVQLLVDLSFVHEATPLILWTYGAPDDGALALFEHGAQTFIPAVHRVTVASRTGFKQLLSQFVAHLTGAPPTPIQLHRLNEALAALA